MTMKGSGLYLANNQGAAYYAQIISFYLILAYVVDDGGVVLIQVKSHVPLTLGFI